MNYREYLDNAKKIQLSKNFTLYELVKSNEALLKGIDNKPENSKIVGSLQVLTKKVLQPLRDWYKLPVTITSGYRSNALNTFNNGAKFSQHLKGEAVDFVIKGIPLAEIVNYIRHNIDFDQLILEPSWIHVSFSGKNRKEVLKFDGKQYIKI